MLDPEQRIMEALRDHDARLRHLERLETIARALAAGDADTLGGKAESALDVDKVDGYHAADLLGVDITTYYDEEDTAESFTALSWTSHSVSRSVTVASGDIVIAICAFDWYIDLARTQAAYFRMSIGGTGYGGTKVWSNPYNAAYAPGVVIGRRVADSSTSYTAVLQVYVYESGRTVYVGDMQLLTMHIH